MKIIYPYNEVLPLKKAHDAYVIRNCASLAALGHDVTLLIGEKSWSREALLKFYKIDPKNPLKVVTLPILRRKNILRLQWNYLFFHKAQKYIEKEKPNWVICSVLKQAHFHVSRRVQGCKYLYEVHQMAWYPTLKGQMNLKKIHFEKSIFSKMDLITVTTVRLKELLQIYPYQIKTPIHKVPLACDFLPIAKKDNHSKWVQLFYVGQLYGAQGIDFLLSALKETSKIHLTVIGGKESEVENYREKCMEYGLSDRISFKGFMTTQELNEEIKTADAFIAPFRNIERMPYVAHTKLREYQSWQRPIVAPNLEVVFEEVPHGVLPYQLDQLSSLKEALTCLSNRKLYERLLKDIQKNEPFTWEKRGYLFNKILTMMPFNISAHAQEVTSK